MPRSRIRVLLRFLLFTLFAFGISVPHQVMAEAARATTRNQPR
jgi:hypothetical protein